MRREARGVKPEALSRVSLIVYRGSDPDKRFTIYDIRFTIND
jgi:hypothetical protein